MITITITVDASCEGDGAVIKKLVSKELQKLHLPSSTSVSLQKRSVDARHGLVKVHLRYLVEDGTSAKNDSANSNHAMGGAPLWVPGVMQSLSSEKVVIVGAGPAGLFAALTLVGRGVPCAIIERGKDVHSRRVDVANLMKTGTVDEDSNFCFGAGGAGAFSDGKLRTKSHKRGNISQILQTLVHFGANKNILTDANPHIGSDILPKIISNITQYLMDNGCPIYFDERVVDFVVSQQKDVPLSCLSERLAPKISGVVTRNVNTGGTITHVASKVILATGHSATDIYRLLAKIAPASIEAKDFAIGVRVEHPRAVIDAIQYHGKIQSSGAQYKLTAQVNERGVYSFCMCPGGVVVPSQTEANTIVVNGMSASARAGKWSNSAIVVQTCVEDIPRNFFEKAGELGCRALAPLLYRSSLEAAAFVAGNSPLVEPTFSQNTRAPAQLLTDFLHHRASAFLPKSSYCAGITSSRLDKWLPQQIATRLAAAFKEYEKSMKGYICDDALLIGIETRTSTPVRVVREKSSGECVAIRGLYPCGEGSGYAGGITTSALDGVFVATRI